MKVPHKLYKPAANKSTLAKVLESPKAVLAELLIVSLSMLQGPSESKLTQLVSDFHHVLRSVPRIYSTSSAQKG